MSTRPDHGCGVACNCARVCAVASWLMATEVETVRQKQFGHPQVFR